MSPRDEHLKWCKERALEYVEQGEVSGAYASFISDMAKHPETREHSALGLGMLMMASGHLSSPHEMRKFIEGFN